VSVTHGDIWQDGAIEVVIGIEGVIYLLAAALRGSRPGVQSASLIMMSLITS